jgi:biotin-dependent carboxylase-like uncharacterized protein
MSQLKVLKAGIQTLIQDEGRFGLNHLGVSHAGYLDEYAALWANKLLDNDSNDPLLVILFGGVEFEAEAQTSISITGAKCEFYINDEPKDIWQNHIINAGDNIKIGKVLNGNRIYLAIKDGFHLAKELGSVSTSVKEGFGGLDGAKIKTNSILTYHPNVYNTPKRVSESMIPNYEEELILRVVLSYQSEHFPKEELEKFFSSSFEVTPDFNRMACKLKGEPIACDIDGIISEGISFGAIQVPKDGQPIILLKERQTIGGYPKIGSVLPIDCFKLAQAKIGSFIRFEAIEINESQKKMKKFYGIFK